MAFLDNSGDIVLDAVLTDLGRKRLAAGQFVVSKFALGDEEINYKLFNPSDARGSTHYDLEIMQTPILEAFTSDQSIMKSRLVTFNTTQLLYLPILKLNTKHSPSMGHTAFDKHGFYLLADDATFTAAAGADGQLTQGVIPGHLREARAYERTQTKFIAVDQGIDSIDGGRTIFSNMDGDFTEETFLVKLDSRFLKLEYPTDSVGNAISLIPEPSFLDEDHIATYQVNMDEYVGSVVYRQVGESGFRQRALMTGSREERNANRATIEALEMFKGPLGPVLRLTPSVTEEIEYSSNFFTTLGTSAGALSIPTDIGAHKYIDTTISVQGMITGYSLDIPIRIVKKD